MPSTDRCTNPAGTRAVSILITDLWTHCFQVILCAGDDTIEPPRLKVDENGDILGGIVDGMGYSHQCRDSRLAWETIMKTEKEPLQNLEWRQGDTVQSSFGT